MYATAIAKHLNILESAIVRVEEWANCLFAVVTGLGGRFISYKVIEKMEFHGIEVAFIPEGNYWFPNGCWYISTFGQSSMSHFVATEKEIQERCKIVAQGKSIPSGKLDRQAYESFCERFGINPFTDEKISNSTYGIKYGDYAPWEKSYLHNELMKRRLAGISSKTSSTEKQPSNDRLAAAMGMVKTANGWMDEDEWLERQEAGID